MPTSCGVFDVLTDTPPNTIGREDLKALVRTAPEDHSGIYTYALQILSSLQVAPSCNRLATSTLLDSCHSIDGSKGDAESHIEDVRSIYAAQLAICEIAGANSTVPSPCRTLAPSPDTRSLRDGPSLRLRKAQLGECLQALESRPQWWTSYSNSRQNAVVMCQAARVDIDKDDLIRLYQKIVETHSDANAALAQAAQTSHKSLQQLREDFMLAAQAFQDQLKRDSESLNTRMQLYFGKLMDSLESAFQATLSRVRSTASAMDSDMASLSKKINAASAVSAGLEKKVGRVLQKVVEGSAELAEVNTVQLEASRGMAKELQVSLQTLQEGDVSTLIQALGEMGLRLESSHQIIAKIYDRQNNIEERMSYLSQSFTELETKAEAFSAAQTRQADLQTRLHDQMEVDMQVTQGYLSEVATAAIHLQATIATTSSKIQSMTAFARAFGSILDWAALACVGFIFLFAAGTMVTVDE
ncbi:MAG: hypothetical protein Q9163_003233 [Psora crenata]